MLLKNLIIRNNSEQKKITARQKEIKLMTYTEFKQQQADKINSFPIFYAFNQSQFDEAMKENGLTPADTDKIIAVGNGGFIKKSDLEAFDELLTDLSNSNKKAMQDDKIFIEAVKYELANHEYIYNTYQGDFDTLEALGFMLKDKKEQDYNNPKNFNLTPHQLELYYKARKEYLQEEAEAEEDREYGDGWSKLSEEEKEILLAYRDCCDSRAITDDLPEIKERLVFVGDDAKAYFDELADEFIASLTTDSRAAAEISKYFDYEDFRRNEEMDCYTTTINGQDYVFRAY